MLEQALAAGSNEGCDTLGTELYRVALVEGKGLGIRYAGSLITGGDGREEERDTLCLITGREEGRGEKIQ